MNIDRSQYVSQSISGPWRVVQSETQIMNIHSHNTTVSQAVGHQEELSVRDRKNKDRKKHNTRQLIGMMVPIVNQYISKSVSVRDTKNEYRQAQYVSQSSSGPPRGCQSETEKPKTEKTQYVI